KRQQPADIGWRHEVPGRAQQMCAEHGALCKRSLNIDVSHAAVQTHAERPLCAAVVLSLNSAKPLHHVLRRLCLTAEEVLAEQSMFSDVFPGHFVAESSAKSVLQCLINQKGAAPMPQSIPEGWHNITPRIVVQDVARLVEFLKQAFGASGEFKPDSPSI